MIDVMLSKNCNATSDDSIANLVLNPARNIDFSNVISPAAGGVVYRPSGDTYIIEEYEIYKEYGNLESEP